MAVELDPSPPYGAVLVLCCTASGRPGPRLLEGVEFCMSAQSLHWRKRRRRRRRVSGKFVLVESSVSSLGVPLC